MTGALCPEMTSINYPVYNYQQYISYGSNPPAHMISPEGSMAKHYNWFGVGGENVLKHFSLIVSNARAVPSNDVEIKTPTLLGTN